MKNLLTPCAVAVLLLLAPGVQLGAQSLGPARAEAWIGRPLEVTVPARFAGNDGDECVRAEVWYGDSRLGDAQVRTTVVGSEGQRRVRVEAQPLVDEPIVTVQVRAGCRNTVTRSYTVLPEYPSEQMLAAAPLPGVARPPLVTNPAVLAQAAGASPRLPITRALSLAPSGPGAATTLANAREEAAPRIRSVVRTATTRAPRMEAPAGARLRLDDWRPDAQTLLRVSAHLSEPSQDAARRATAALLWKALNAEPQEVLRTSAMLQKLEGDLALLRQSSGQTRAELAALRQRLDAPQPAFLSFRTVQLLVFLLVALSGTAAFLWWRNSRRQPQPGAWYAPGDSTYDSILPPVAEQPAVTERTAAQEPMSGFHDPAGAAAERATPIPLAPMAPSVVVRRTPAPPPEPESNMIEFDLPAQVAQAGGVAPGLAMPQARPRAAGSLMRVETLAATFDEVEFLASLGLWNDATDVLKTYLKDASAPAPIAFWELIRLNTLADDAEGAAAVRKRYMQLFGIAAPSLDRINAPLGLESHPNLAEEVIGAWGRRDVLDIIEHHLFDIPPPDRAFTLQAGRDLLVLHDLTMTLLRESQGVDEANDAEAHAMAPWADADDPQQAAQDAAEVSGGHAFALDLDLNAAPEPLPEPDLALADPDLAPLLAELHEAAARNAAEKARLADDDAFSAATRSEPVRRR